MRLWFFITISLILTCLTCGCLSHTINPPPVTGPPPVAPGEGITNYGGSTIAISFSSNEISTSSPAAKELFQEGLTRLTQYGQYNESLQYFDGALRIDRNFTEAWVAKGVAFHNMKRYHDAITCFDTALEIRPDDAGVWYLKGMTYRDWGKNVEAAECNRRAAELDPRYGNG